MPPTLAMAGTGHGAGPAAPAGMRRGGRSLTAVTGVSSSSTLHQVRDLEGQARANGRARLDTAGGLRYHAFVAFGAAS